MSTVWILVRERSEEPSTLLSAHASRAGAAAKRRTYADVQDIPLDNDAAETWNSRDFYEGLCIVGLAVEP